MKALLISLVLLGPATVMADELAEGIKAWEKQDFARAHQVLGKLAANGDAEAQLLVGEMYGFGEGVAEDFAQAELWLSKAKAGGNKDAAESLQNMQQRRVRKQDIALYIAAYKGDDVKFDNYNCVAPVFPETSRTKAKIKEVQGQMDAWMACYERFAKGLQAALPAGKLIPADLAKLMSLGELQQARNNMEKVYVQLDADARLYGGKLLAAHEAWYERIVADQKKRSLEAEQQAMQLGTLNQSYRDLMTSPSPLFLPNGSRASLGR